MRFAVGFAVATLLWGIVFFLYANGHLGGTPAEAEALAEQAQRPTRKARRDGRPGRRARRRPRRRPAGGGRAAEPDRRETSSGDDVGWDDARAVDMAGGQEQLPASEIERGFDREFGRIRRCLLLVPGDAEVRGRLTFGLRVGPDGAVKAVNLRGPAYVTQGESGACLRKAARSIRFASFDGPDMVFKYPIDLE